VVSGSECADPPISVVIPTRGRPKMARAVVQAALEDTATAEVIVVVDGQDDATVRELADLERADPRLRVSTLTAKPSGGGGGRARDKGVRVATSECVLLLDDDVIPEPGLVTGHARRHAEEDGLVVVGYMPVRSVRRWPRPGGHERLYAQSYERMCRHYEAAPAEILRGLWAGNVSVRRADWLAVIAERRAPLRYHEDAEVGIALHRRGLRAVFDRKLRARHCYQRSLSAFARDAVASGRDQVQLHAAHPDLVAEADTRSWRRGRRVVLAPMALGTHHPGPWTVTRTLLIAAARTAALLGLRRAEERVAALLRSLAFAHGAREAARASPSS
jgi:glycosyltransferase involved in cell wall biosynthesis